MEVPERQSFRAKNPMSAFHSSSEEGQSSRQGQTFFDSLPNTVLEAVGGLEFKFSDADQNPAIIDALHKTVLVGGKRLRPLLTFLMGEFLGVPLEKLAPYAQCIESVHASSLAHDDVIDNASSRRGAPSLNALTSNKKAVLAGDYLLAQVIVELTRLGHLALVQEMAHVIKELSDGEWLQLELHESGAYSSAKIEDVARKKTASVLSWCCVAPSYLAGLNLEERELARALGENLGLAFQLGDDILDFDPDSPKSAFQDLNNGLINAVTFEVFALQGLSSQEVQLKVKALQNQTLQGELCTTQELKSGIEQVRSKVKNRINTALEQLEALATSHSQRLSQTRSKNAYHSLVLMSQYLIERKF